MVLLRWRSTKQLHCAKTVDEGDSFGERERRGETVAWTMEETRRVRLLFKDKDAILSQSQKSQGFKRCWLLLKPQHQTIADLSNYILNAFGLYPSCPHGLILCLDGFVLPPFESTDILKDKDIISVRKNPLTLCLEGNNAVHAVEELQIMDEQPVNSGALLLTNEEFDKETGGYQSDEPEDDSKEEDEVDKSADVTEEEDEEEQLEDSLHREKSSGVDATSKKRKAPERLQGSKNKKQRFEVQESIQNDVSENQVGNSHQDNRHARKDTSPDAGRISNLKKKKEGAGDKRNVELNGSNMDASPDTKETDQIKNDRDKSLVASEGTRKGPSRSARRKKAKRRWIREMAKIQKQADVSQPKGLQNWKQKPAPARAGRKKHNNWKQKPVPDYIKEDNGEPKGLLHWKSWSAKDKCDDKRDDKETHQNGSTSEQSNQKNNIEDEFVPVVIRPGHIRFEPLEGDQVERQSQVSGESLQWNGITSKRKGQKWGTEKPSYSQRNNNKDVNEVQSPMLSTSKETNLNYPIDFDKLPPLSVLPKEGDVIAYRILELSSSWTPELSSYRVGHVSSCIPQSGKVLLMPVPEHPIIFGKSGEDESDQQLDNSLYKEDGSLEIDFSTLADVRIVKDGLGGPREAEINGANGGPNPNENAVLLVTPTTSKDKQIQASTPGNGEVNHGDQTNDSAAGNGGDLWEEISEALSAKKAQLSQESSWGKTKASTGTWSYRALKGSAMGPTMALLRSKNKLRNN